MPAYGPYECTREIASGHGSVVFSAHKAGETKDQYAVKVFALDPFIGGDEEARSELDPLAAEFYRNFTSSVELQKRAAEVSRHVAPIFEVGQEPRSAWYVTKLYPRTVHKILEGRIALSKEWFFHIIHSVTSGALDLKRSCGRSHGEILPSNILISASEKVRDAQVVLSDPLPGGASEAARYEAADLKAIGQIIFQLVRHREIEDASDHSILPLLPSAEWTTIFGKDTAAWLSLCNRLLDPNLSLDSYNLEKLQADLGKLQPKPPVTGRVLALAAVGILLASLAMVYFVHASGRGSLLIFSDPPGARIQLTDANGQSTHASTPPDGKPLKLTLAKGTYSVRAEQAGLDGLTNTVDLGGRQERPLAFTFQYGTIILDSQPRGAAIRVDGTNLLRGTAPAVTPYSISAFKPGPVTFTLDLKERSYLPTNLPIVVQPGHTTNLFATLTQLAAGQVLVEFDSTPRGADIELNGKLFARTLETKPLAPGTYPLVARFRELWPPKRATLIVRPNEATNVSFYFERARVTLESDPAGASIWVSNRFVGLTPTNGMLWPTGLVTFRLEKTGYEVTTVTTNISEDNARLELRPELVTTNGTILLTIDEAPAVVVEASTREQYQTAPGKTLEITRPPGPRLFLIQAAGYESVTTNFDFASKQKIRKIVRLPEKLIPVAFSSRPPGAEIFVVGNNQALGPVEAVAPLAAANYQFAARIPYLPRLGWITNDVPVATNRPNAHVFEFPATTLLITSSPPRVEVFDVSFPGRRELLGRTPTNLIVRPGPVVLEFVSTNGTDINTNYFNIVTTGSTNIGTYFRPPKPPPYVNSIGMVFEWIPVEGTNGGYWVGKYEVTQQQYERIMGVNPSRHKLAESTNFPVETVGLTNVLEFCGRLTAQDQRSLEAAPDSLAHWTYQLPTPAQWTYYAESSLANAVIARDRPQAVGSLAPNEFGLYDVRGNVWEWCSDGALRGAAYSSRPGFNGKQLEHSYALRLPPIQPAGFETGFRCLLVPPSQTARR